MIKLTTKIEKRKQVYDKSAGKRKMFNENYLVWWKESLRPDAQ